MHIVYTKRKNEKMNELTRLRRRLSGYFRNKTFVVVFGVACVYFLYNFNFILFAYRLATGSQKHTYKSEVEILYTSEEFANKLNLSRINRLFAMLQKREVALKPAKRAAEEDVLKLFSFERLKRLKLKQTGSLPDTNTTFYEVHANEIDRYMRLNEATHLIEATDEFASYLTNMSVKYTIKRPRTRIVKSKLNLVGVFVLFLGMAIS